MNIDVGFTYCFFININIGSNSKEQKEIILKFKDKEGKDWEYRAKFFNSHIGGVGAIIFKGTNSNINSRNLFRYPNYEKSKFEKRR